MKIELHLNLEHFEWEGVPKDSPMIAGGKHLVLSFGSLYLLSIINDGYGHKDGLLEIGAFNIWGEPLTMPGITEEDQNIKGFLDISEVCGIIKKLISLSGKTPVQEKGPMWEIQERLTDLQGKF